MVRNLRRHPRRRKRRPKNPSGKLGPGPISPDGIGEIMAQKEKDDKPSVPSLITRLNQDFDVRLYEVADVLAEGRTDEGPSVDDLMDWLTTAEPMARGDPADLDKLQAFYSRLEEVKKKKRRPGRAS